MREKFFIRDTENRLKPGFYSYLAIFAAVFIIGVYVFGRMLSQPEARMSKAEREKHTVPTNISTLNAPLNNWQESEFTEAGENAIIRDKTREDVLSSRASVFSPIKNATFKDNQPGTLPYLDLKGLKEVTGDDGGRYIKSDRGIYALNVPGGTELSGKNKSYVVGEEDLKLYQIYDGGKRREANSPISYKLKDKEGRFYIVTDSMQLRLHTPGGEGRFVGPDGKSYNVLNSGDIEDVGENSIVNSISGDGEFTGTDDLRYVVMRGILFSPASRDTSFSKGIIGGKGYFKGPDGKTYIIGEDGKVYWVLDDGKLLPSNIGGSGTFIGPDGATYIKESNGEIRKIAGAAANGISQKTDLSEGFFIGPDGKKYYVNDNGEIFTVDSEGKLIPGEISGSGSFVGPDGKHYRIVDGKIIQDENPSLIDRSAFGQYLTGEDGKKYFIDETGNTFLVEKSGRLIPSKLPKGKYFGEDGSIFKADENGNVLLDSLKLPAGTYTDERGKKYYVDKNGDFFEIDENGNLLSSALPSGILKSEDGKQYIITPDGRINAETNANAGYLPEGYFYAPDGMLKYSDGQGNFYEILPDGTIRKIDKLSPGNFFGPDGKQCSIDQNSRIVKGYDSGSKPDSKTGIEKHKIEKAEVFPKRNTAQVNVSANLQNYNTGDESFSPEKEVAKLKGGRIYTLPPVEKEMGTSKPNKAIAKQDKIMPVGIRIPFYLLTHITTNFESGSLIEASVAENVFFHELVIPAGTRIYGTVGEVGSNNRLKLNFNFLLYHNGKSVPISADAYDVNMQFGIEAYFTPTPTWVYALRFLNVASIYELTSKQGHSDSGEPIGDLDEVVKYLNDTIKEIEHKQQAYYTIPAGTPGILMLTSNLNLSEIDMEGSSIPSKKAEPLLSEKERLERIKFNIMQKQQEIKFSTPEETYLQ